MTNLLKKYKLTMTGVGLGAISGLIYVKFFGCTSGCPIKSNYLNMGLYTAFMGGLLFNMIETEIKKKKKDGTK